MNHLFTPWRFRYISGETRRDPGCIFCAAAASPDLEGTLTLHVGTGNFVIMNRYPYTSGHLMIAPIAHTASLPALGAEARSEMMELAVASQEILEETYRPGGWNIGMNLGVSGGAGIADHLHLHVVPRWAGDTNFMTSLAATRLVPEELGATWGRLRERFVRRFGTGGGTR